MTTRYILFLVAFSWSILVVAQEKQVWLHGKVVSSLDSIPIPLAQLASYKKVNLFAADSIGEFRVILSESDSIKVIALGFEPRVFYLDSLAIDPDQMIYLPLDQATYQIQQVDINFYKAYSGHSARLKELRRQQMEMNLGLPADIKLGKMVREVPADIQPVFEKKPPVYAALVHPLSFVHYHTSKSEKRKKKMIKLLKDEKQRNMLSPELIKTISGYKGKELEQFIVYCNANIAFTASDNETSIKYKVIDLLTTYKKRTL